MRRIRLPDTYLEYHPPCPAHCDGDHQEISGMYVCECGATCAWHRLEPMEIDWIAAHQIIEANITSNGHITREAVVGAISTALDRGDITPTAPPSQLGSWRGDPSL